MKNERIFRKRPIKATPHGVITRKMFRKYRRRPERSRTSCFISPPPALESRPSNALWYGRVDLPPERDGDTKKGNRDVCTADSFIVNKHYASREYLSSFT